MNQKVGQGKRAEVMGSLTNQKGGSPVEHEFAHYISYKFYHYFLAYFGMDQSVDSDIDF